MSLLALLSLAQLQALSAAVSAAPVTTPAARVQNLLGPGGGVVRHGHLTLKLDPDTAYVLGTAR